MNILHAALLLAASIPRLAAGQEPPATGRRLDAVVAVTNSDNYAETVVSVEAPEKHAPGINARDYAMITDAMAESRNLAETGRALLLEERTQKEGQVMMNRAHAIFAKVNSIIQRSLSADGTGEDKRTLLRKKYSNHNLNSAKEDEGRALDVAGRLVRHLIEHEQGTTSFPECSQRKVQHCKSIINRYLRENGLKHKIKIKVFKKRPAQRDPNDEGYNKVVIVTNSFGDLVAEEPSYPDGWLWNGRTIGPWPDCVDQGVATTPAACCLHIKEDVTDKDNGRNIECQFFTPKLDGVGGVHYPEVKNSVVLNESTDGRVQERPYIQADFDLP